MRKKTITVTKTDKVKKRKKVPQTQTKQVSENDLEMSQYSVHTKRDRTPPARNLLKSTRGYQNSQS